MKKLSLFFLVMCLFSVVYSQKWNSLLNMDNGKVGIIDNQGRTIVPSNYYDVQLLDTTFAVLTDSLRLKGLVNDQGKFVIPIQYEKIERFFESKWYDYISDSRELFLVRKNYKKGIFKIDVGVIIPCDYENIKNFKFQITYSNYFYSEKQICLFHPVYQCAMAQMNGKWGLIDPSNKLVLPYDYDQFGIAYKDILLVERNDKWGAISLLTKKEVVENVFDTIYTPILFDELNQTFLFTALLKDSLVVVNTNGKIFPVSQTEVPNFRLINPEFGITEGEKGMTLYYYKTHKKIETSYLNGYYYRLWDNSSIFHDNNTMKPVLLDVNGNELYKFKKMMTDSYEGNFVIGNRYFFDGTQIFEKTPSGFNVKYILPSNKSTFLDYVIEGYPSFIILKQNKKYGVLLRTQDSINVVLPFEYDKIDYREEYYYEESMPITVKKDNLVGLILLENRVFKWAIPIEYESIETFDHLVYYVKKNGKYGLYIINEGLRIPCEYKSKQNATINF